MHRVDPADKMMWNLPGIVELRWCEIPSCLSPQPSVLKSVFLSDLSAASDRGWLWVTETMLRKRLIFREQEEAAEEHRKIG